MIGSILRFLFPPEEPYEEQGYTLTNLDDRLDFACMQLVIHQERTGRITEDNVCQAAFEWSDEGNDEQYTWLKTNLMEMVTA